MKFSFINIVFGTFLIISHTCRTPYDSVQMEVLVPSQINLPVNFNKIMLVNLATDIRLDGKIDTTFYDIISEEINYGFEHVIENSLGIDSTNFIFKKEKYSRNNLYHLETVSWQKKSALAAISDVDILVLLDSADFSIDTGIIAEEFYDTILNYSYNKMAVNVYWSVFNLLTKRRLDRYHYKDSLVWKSFGYTAMNATKNIPGPERSIREACYFAATDYANRIFPGWKDEPRYYFNHGNADFKKAIKFVKNHNWDEASRIWKKYSMDEDPGISCRACFNMALVSELKGDLTLAIVWAEKSLEIIENEKTKEYIIRLKNRQKELDKLKNQFY